MEANQSVWHHYQPGYVHPDFAPYQRKIVKDRKGNDVSINTWERNGDSLNVEPSLVRINKGMSFMRLFESDPCPPGWVKDEENLAMCIQRPLKHEPIFYSKKAFIAKRQFFQGYADTENPGERRISEPTDMRSVNPLTGKYQVYHKPVSSRADGKYMKPINPSKGKYDQSWNLPRQTGHYLPLATEDSYL